MIDEYEVTSFRPVPGRKGVYTRHRTEDKLGRKTAIAEAKHRSMHNDVGVVVLRWDGDRWYHVDWHHPNA